MTYWNHIVILEEVDVCVFMLLDMCVFFKECVYVSVTPQRHPNYHTEKIYREEVRCVCVHEGALARQEE